MPARAWSTNYPDNVRTPGCVSCAGRRDIEAGGGERRWPQIVESGAKVEHVVARVGRNGVGSDKQEQERHDSNKETYRNSAALSTSSLPPHSGAKPEIGMLNSVAVARLLVDRVALEAAIAVIFATLGR